MGKVIQCPFLKSEELYLKLKKELNSIEQKINSEFENIYNNLVNVDPFMCLADFDSYAKAHEKVNEAYSDRERFMKMSLSNIAGAGMFSSDRSIKEYAEKIKEYQKLHQKLQYYYMYDYKEE